MGVRVSLNEQREAAGVGVLLKVRVVLHVQRSQDPVLRPSRSLAPGFGPALLRPLAHAKLIKQPVIDAKQVP